MDKAVKTKHCIIDIIAIAVLIFIDQFTKQLAVDKLMDKEPFVIIDGVFELSYLENKGAAFGVFQNKQMLFLIISSIFLILLIYVAIKLPTTKRYLLLECIICCLCAGAIGNMIDRIVNNYVVDFFYFSLIDFPIFNVADIYVSVSTVCLGIILLFVFKEEDFEFLSSKRKKDENL